MKPSPESRPTCQLESAFEWRILAIRKGKELSHQKSCHDPQPVQKFCRKCRARPFMFIKIRSRLRLLKRMSSQIPNQVAAFTYISLSHARLIPQPSHSISLKFLVFRQEAKDRNEFRLEASSAPKWFILLGLRPWK